MSISLKCPCGRILHVSLQSAGTRIQCACGELLEVPAWSDLRRAQTDNVALEAQTGSPAKEPTWPVQRAARVLATLSPLHQRVCLEGLNNYVRAALDLMWQVAGEPASINALQVDLAILFGECLCEIQWDGADADVLAKMQQVLRDLMRPHVVLPVAVSLLVCHMDANDAPPWKAPFPQFLGGRAEQVLDRLLCERARVAPSEIPAEAKQPSAPRWSMLSRWWKQLREFLGINTHSQSCLVSLAFDEAQPGPEAPGWLAALNEHLEEHPNCVDTLARRALLYLRRSQYLLAKDDFTRAIIAGGGEPWHFRERARARLLLNQMDEARQDLDQALTQDAADVDALVLRANLLGEQEKWEEAYRDCACAMELEPLSPRLRVIAAQALANAGHSDHAAEELGKAIALDPFHEPAYRLRGILNMLHGTEPDRQQALADLSRALELDETNATSYFYRAQLQAGMGALPAARADCDRVIELDPEMVGAYSIRAEVRCRQGDFQGAIDDATYAATKQATAFVFLVRGQAYLGLSDSQRGAEDFRMALEIDPGDARAHHALGMVHEQAGDMDEAMASYSRAIELAPRWPRLYLDRGNCHRSQEDNDAALADYDEVIRLDPGVAAAWMNRGLIMAERGEMQEASACFREGVRLDPRDAQSHLLYGKALVTGGEFAAARDALTRALALDSNLFEAALDRAKAHLALGDYQAAIDDYDHVLEHAPTLSSAYFGRAMAWMHLGDDARCSEDLREAVECDPGGAESIQFSWLMNEASLRNSQERYDEAIACCEQVLSESPDSLDALSVRAAAFWYSDQLIEAAEDYSRILEIDDDLLVAFIGRGQVYAEMGEFSLALADLDRAVELARSKSEAKELLAYPLSGRGLSKAGLGRIEDAMADFAESVCLCPANAWVYYNMGLVYHTNQESQKAATCFKLALRVDEPALTPRKRRRASAYLEAMPYSV